MMIRGSVILAVAGSFLLASSSALSQAEREPPMIRTPQEQFVVQELSADAQGTLSFTRDRVGSRLRRDQYIWAWVPIPKEIWEANRDLLRDKKFAESLAGYEKAYPNYRFLGWDIHIALRSAQAMVGLNQKDKAIARLEQELSSFELNNPAKQEDDYNEALKLLVNLLIEKKDYDKAQQYLSSLEQSSNQQNVAAAINAKGDILRQQGRVKDAILQYLQTTLMFPKELIDPKDQTKKAFAERADAMLNLVQILERENDARAKIWAQKLRDDYPGSPHVGKLK